MGGQANLNLLYHLTSSSNASAVIETGVAYGWSSLAILLALNGKNDARLISTNLHYREYEDDRFVGCAVPDRLRNAWTIIHEPDNTGAAKAIAASTKLLKSGCPSLGVEWNSGWN